LVPCFQLYKKKIKRADDEKFICVSSCQKIIKVEHSFAKFL